MKAVSQYFQRVIWFLPLEKFVIGFGLYMLAGIFALMAQGMNIFQALTLSFASGVVLTLVVSAAYSMRRLEGQGYDSKSLVRRLLFGPLRESRTEADGEPPSGIENEEFKRRMRTNQIDAAKRAARKMHDKVIQTSLVIVIYMLLFWFLADSISGFFTTLFGAGAASSGAMLGAQSEISFETPKELFIFDWKVLAIMWFILIVLLPRWLVYILMIGMSGMRIVFLVFGPMASIWIMNMGQLPFFYGLMMIFMFGSMLWPFLQQIKYYKPGDASWGTPKGSMRGQPEVRAIVETELAKFKDYIDGKSKRRPTRGIIFEGPPGTGKTLYAKEIATEYNIPFVLADGAALQGMPMPQLSLKYVEWRANSLADEYGGVVFFIDEAELLLQVRQGMTGGGQMGGMEVAGVKHDEIRDIWDLLPYDSIGVTSSCGLLYDSSQARERFWQMKSPLALGKESKTYRHSFFFPANMGGGGGGAIYPFLTWLQGTGSPPFMETFKRGIVNNLLNGLFIPPNIPKTQILLRMPPAKPKEFIYIFVGATNRAWMIDPAIRRPGRMGVTARFKTPDIESRKDIIDLYLTKADQDGLLRPELLKKEAIDEFARATSNMSPAEIEATIYSSCDMRGTHVKNLKRIKALLDSGVALDKLLEQDRKYWLRHEDEVKKESWDDDRADMRSLLEARNTLIYGRADPGLTTAEHREETAIHEYWGHFIILKAALGNAMRPSVISVMPRGQALGMVAHTDIEERDPRPQRFYEGLIRLSLGSLVAERFFFGENQPGVSSDLENATRIACFMTGKAGMVPYRCAPKDRKRFAEIGETLIAVPDTQIASLNPFAQGFVEKVLANPSSRERVAAMLGQAFVDDYRLIRANVAKDYEFHKSVVADLLRLDELGGGMLEKVWEKLDEILIDWDHLNDKQRSWWPHKIAVVENVFYDSSKKPEIEEVLPNEAPH
ncbi:MAG: AAA family ATPase [Candidatus Nealsonbacteria bacterium]|nr:AAA family ATPase [Candidatus Nealsonbacteria bacterium]